VFSIDIWGTMSLQRNIRSSSLVRDRLSKRQKEMIPSEKARYLRDIRVML
jgi:Mg2+ and Co2+ transporter CorA